MQRKQPIHMDYHFNLPSISTFYWCYLILFTKFSIKYKFFCPNDIFIKIGLQNLRVIKPPRQNQRLYCGESRGTYKKTKYIDITVCLLIMFPYTTLTKWGWNVIIVFYQVLYSNKMPQTKNLGSTFEYNVPVAVENRTEVIARKLNHLLYYSVWSCCFKINTLICVVWWKDTV